VEKDFVSIMAAEFLGKNIPLSLDNQLVSISNPSPQLQILSSQLLEDDRNG
jgi:hypothetical protein